jgi:hypothetical protein
MVEMNPTVVGVVLVAIAIVMYIRRDPGETPTAPAKGSGSAVPLAPTTGSDADGSKLEPKLDDCLRTTMESLALPPFKVRGSLRVKYSFVFE